MVLGDFENTPISPGGMNSSSKKGFPNTTTLYFVPHATGSELIPFTSSSSIQAPSFLLTY